MRMIKRINMIPMLVFLVLSITVASIWQLNRINKTSQIKATSALVSEQVAVRLKTFLDARLGISPHFQQLWEKNLINTQQLFLDEARSMHTLFSQFQSINWVDPNGIIQWVSPYEGNVAAIGLDIRQHPLAGPVLAAAEDIGRIQISPPLTLKQGGMGFSTYTPLYREGVLEGFLNLVFQIDPLVSTAIVETTIKDKYDLFFHDEDELIKASSQEAADPVYSVKRGFSIANRQWSVTASPKPAVMNGFESPFEKALLLLGLLFSTGLAWVLRLYLQRQQALKEKTDLLEVIMDNMSEGITLFDRNLTLQVFNHRMVELLEQPENFLAVGDSFEKLIRFNAERGDYGDGDVEGLVAARIKTAQGFEGYSLERTLPSGRILSITARPAPDGGFVSTYHDMTEHRQVEANLRIALIEAERANQAKSDFLATMSHEFRTPLNAILGFSEMIQAQTFGPLGDQKYKDYAKDIHDSGHYLLALITDILDISAIEAGKRNLLKEHLNLVDLLAECLKSLDYAAKVKGIHLENRIADSTPRLYADERAIRQIFLNLLSNAVKFTEKGGAVSVISETSRNYILITVKDTGIGIDPLTLSRIAQPFVRGQTNAHHAHEGTGLGLAISKSLVEIHGGTMTINSVVNEGTSVEIRLPRISE